MKRLILASVLFSVLLNTLQGSALAAQVCGVMGSHTVRPHCDPDRACPMWVRLQYDLTTPEGTRIDISSSDAAVSGEFSSLQGQRACLEGQFERNPVLGDFFDVTSIAAL